MGIMNASKITDVINYFDNSKSNKIVARCGLRTNGDIHIGNMMPIISGFIIGNELTKKGYDYNLIISLVDLEDGDDIPFIYQDDSKQCHQNLAEHSMAIINSFVKELETRYTNVNFSLHKISEFLKKETVRESIKKGLEEKTIKQLIKIVCTNCYHINQNLICENCKQKIDENNPIYALNHDLLGTIENIYFKPNIHIIGRDHAIVNSNGCSQLGYRELYKKILFPDEKSNLLIFLTPLIFDSKGNKMSKSTHNGIFLEELITKYGNNSIHLISKITEEMIVQETKDIQYYTIRNMLEEKCQSK